MAGDGQSCTHARRTSFWMFIIHNLGLNRLQSFDYIHIDMRTENVTSSSCSCCIDVYPLVPGVLLVNQMDHELYASSHVFLKESVNVRLLVLFSTVSDSLNNLIYFQT